MLGIEGNLEAAPMDRPQSSDQPKMAFYATAGVRFTKFIGEISLMVNGIGTRPLPLRLAGDRPNAHSMSGPRIVYMRMPRGEDASQ